MGLLVIRKRGREERVFRIRGERVTIGRDENAKLVLSHVSVSRQHARLTTRGPHCELEDLGSTNGLKVNGTKTRRHELTHGDILKIGAYVLEYVDERHLDLLQVTRLSGLRSTCNSTLVKDQKTHCYQPAELDALELGDEDSRYALLERCDKEGGRWRPGSGRLTIGPGGDVPLDIPLHSQPVAEIRWDGSHHVLTASSWALRVEVNGTRTREAVLEPGSTLRVADATFEFVHEPNDEPSY